MTVIKRREFWSTPCSSDCNGTGKTPRDRLDYAVNGETKSKVYPTPRALSLCGGSGSYQKIKSHINLTDEEKRGLTSTHGQLHPDWEERLMAWPVGWTDLETPNIRLVWLDPSIDPADYGEIPRVTNRRENRRARVKEIGNGQFPLAAAVAFHWGLCVLEVVI